MSVDRSHLRYRDPNGPHALCAERFCAECETFAVLRQVEGFWEALSDPPTNAVIDAVEAAALRGFRMGVELAGRFSIDRSREAELDRAAERLLA